MLYSWITLGASVTLIANIFNATSGKNLYLHPNVDVGLVANFNSPVAIAACALKINQIILIKPVAPPTNAPCKLIYLNKLFLFDYNLIWFTVPWTHGRSTPIVKIPNKGPFETEPKLIDNCKTDPSFSTTNTKPTHIDPKIATTALMIILQRKK